MNESKENYQRMELVAKIKQLIQTGYGGVQAHFAKEYGISDAHLINILNQKKWKSVSAKMWYQLEQLFGSAFYETINIVKIQEGCNEAIKSKRVVGIAAYTGASKTTGLKDFRDNNKAAYYVLCDTLMSRRDLIKEVADKMPLSANDGKIRSLQKAIAKQLIQTDNAVLIFDSASKLRIDALQWIGDLAELVEKRAGIVIAGTESLRTDIIKYANQNKKGYKEFQRRINLWKSLSKFSSDEVQAELTSILEQEGIKGTQAKDCLKQDNYGSFFDRIELAKQHNKKAAIEQLKNV